MRKALVLFLLCALSSCTTFGITPSEDVLDDSQFRDCSGVSGSALVDCHAANSVACQKFRDSKPSRKEIKRDRISSEKVKVTFRSCWVSKDNGTEIKCAVDSLEIYDPTLWQEFKDSVPWTALTDLGLAALIYGISLL